MAPKKEFNLQDMILNEARKAGTVVTVKMIDGSTVAGIVLSFDKYSIFFVSPVHGDTIIYKHSITMITGVERPN